MMAFGISATFKNYLKKKYLCKTYLFLFKKGFGKNIAFLFAVFTASLSEGWFFRKQTLVCFGLGEISFRPKENISKHCLCSRLPSENPLAFEAKASYGPP